MARTKASNKKSNAANQKRIRMNKGMFRSRLGGITPKTIRGKFTRSSGKNREKGMLRAHGYLGHSSMGDYMKTKSANYAADMRAKHPAFWRRYGKVRVGNKNAITKPITGTYGASPWAISEVDGMGVRGRHLFDTSKRMQVMAKHRKPRYTPRERPKMAMAEHSDSGHCPPGYIHVKSHCRNKPKKSGKKRIAINKYEF
jgi:hypothetical protein